MPTTQHDFWKMVVDRNCQVIVMITNMVENGKVWYLPWSGTKEGAKIRMSKTAYQEFFFYCLRKSVTSTGPRALTQYHTGTLRSLL